MIVVAAALACAAVFLWNRQAGTKAALAATQHQYEDLRSQLEARDQTIIELRSSIERLQHSTVSAPPTELATRANSATSTENDLARRLAELTVLQSNTLALVERLMARAADLQSAPESPRQSEAAVTALELSVAEYQQKLEETKQRAAELVVTLNIPAEVSTMDASKALDIANLKPYWPFFEAKRERDSMQLLTERLRMRLAQEQLDARIQARKATGQ
jgi:chromosome segregation ATPase